MEASVVVVGWGQTSDGQLGLGGIEETTINEPRSVTLLYLGTIISTREQQHFWCISRQAAGSVKFFMLHIMEELL